MGNKSSKTIASSLQSVKVKEQSQEKQIKDLSSLTKQELLKICIESRKKDIERQSIRQQLTSALIWFEAICTVFTNNEKEPSKIKSGIQDSNYEQVFVGKFKTIGKVISKGIQWIHNHFKSNASSYFFWIGVLIALAIFGVILYSYLEGITAVQGLKLLLNYVVPIVKAALSSLWQLAKYIGSAIYEVISDKKSKELWCSIVHH